MEVDERRRVEDEANELFAEDEGKN